MPIDYDKLANQFGGSAAGAEDQYDALAKKLGGSTENVSSTATDEKPSLSQFLHHALTGNALGMKKHLPAAVDALKSTGNMVADVGPSVVGAAIGGTLGAPLGPAGIIGGGALGAAAGGQLKDLMNQAVQGEQVPTVPEAAMRRATEAAGGAVQEAAPLVKAVSRGPIVSKEVQQDLTRGMKPISRKTDFNQTLQRAVPEVSAAAKATGKPITGLADLEPTIIDAKKAVWSKYQDLLGPNKSATIDGNQIADAMEKSINQRFATQNPAAADKIRALAKTYRKDMTLGETEDFLQSANNDLDAFYKKYKTDQATAEKDPEIGYVVKEAKALRKALYDKLEQLTGKQADEIKRTYGSLESLQQEVLRRKNVAARQNPESLSEQVSKWSGIGDVAYGAMTGNLPSAAKGAAKMGAARYIKNRNTTDSLVRSAFAKYNAGIGTEPPSDILLRSLPSIRGLVSPQSLGVGQPVQQQ